MSRIVTNFETQMINVKHFLCIREKRWQDKNFVPA